jgi:hypothetical protein
MPANYIHVNTGVTLTSVSGAEGGVNLRSVLLLFVLAFLALLPTLFRKRIEQFESKM